MQPPPPNLEGNRLDVLPKSIDHQMILRAAFGVHFSFTCSVYMGGWCPNVYAYYNAFLIAGYWIASTTTHVDLALMKLMAMEAAAVMLDIFVIAIYYNKSSKEGLDFYCFLAFIAQLIGRFAALLGLHRIRKDRRNAGLTVAEPPLARSDYQQVQGTAHMAAAPPQQSIPQQHVGYDYGVPSKMEAMPDLSARFAHGYQ